MTQAPLASRQPSRRMIAPAAIAAAAPHLLRPGRSPRKTRAKTMPKSIAASLSAATGATGATVMAHRARA